MLFAVRFAWLAWKFGAARLVRLCAFGVLDIYAGTGPGFGWGSRSTGLRSNTGIGISCGERCDTFTRSALLHDYCEMLTGLFGQLAKMRESECYSAGMVVGDVSVVSWRVVMGETGSAPPESSRCFHDYL